MDESFLLWSDVLEINGVSRSVEVLERIDDTEQSNGHVSSLVVYETQRYQENGTDDTSCKNTNEASALYIMYQIYYDQ